MSASTGVVGSARPTHHVTFGIHVAIEFLVGVALAVAPLVFDFAQGATIASLVLGIGIATAAISTSIAGSAVSLHQSWDRSLVVVLAIAAIVSAVEAGGASTLVFAAAALAEGVLAYVTRYVPERR